MSYALTGKLLFTSLGLSVGIILTIMRHHHLLGRMRHSTLIQQLERILIPPATPVLQAPVYPRLDEIEFKPEDRNEDQIHQARRNVEAALLQPIINSQTNGSADSGNENQE